MKKDLFETKKTKINFTRFVWRLIEEIIHVINMSVGQYWRNRFRSRQANWVEKLRLLRAILHFWRFDSLGKSCGLGRRIRFAGNLKIKLGDNSAILNDVTIVGDGSLQIGTNSVVGDSCFLVTHSEIFIADNVMIAAFCYLVDSNHVFFEKGIDIRNQGIATRPIRIEEDVWIGAHTVVLAGTHIGSGAIIGANSVVNGDIPARAIAKGNPARVIGFR
jgi:acetyltransferase-like isoleucine patch superfamily enzyme